ncbi:hypothetical protein NQ315_011517 [Exocentrus adspersus]|uniref:G-protein coupled receptors family 1 profile domain-containing protein n=1 Tax=Exocentrus adspersus TaxID=1586481 RepID=A0AAV8VV89_9CUCU|nr:hypothetical protein NQ315_011517 [Exocentrus adspersus]
MDAIVEADYNESLTLNETIPDVNATEVSIENLFRPNLHVTVVYGVLFVVAAVGNLTVFISLFRSRHRKSRISLMIRHLAMADLIVTFIMIPIEISWRLTGRWLAGNVACKVFLFLRAFGPYLSSNVLVCVSLDRYFAVLHPLKVNDARRRGKIMLAFAWCASFIYCIPQTSAFVGFLNKSRNPTTASRKNISGKLDIVPGRGIIPNHENGNEIEELTFEGSSSDNSDIPSGDSEEILESEKAFLSDHFEEISEYEEQPSTSKENDNTSIKSSKTETEKSYKFLPNNLIVCVIFRVMKHPKYPNYTQCVALDYFSSTAHEVAYNLVCVMFLYFIPLLVIVVAYSAIMYEICKNSKGTQGESYRASNGRMRLRRSDISNIERARSRTLRMTITIVVVYIGCCTPYVIITLWYMFDREGAEKLPEWLQDTFFMMVVSNSCMNPIVYGSYVFTCRKSCCSLFKCFKKGTADTHLTDGDMQLAAGHSREIARRVIKCVLGLKKVGSATTTRSTAIGNVVTRSPVEKSPTQMTGVGIKRSSSKYRPPSLGHTTFFSEHSQSSSHSGRASFHSEPLTNPYPFLEQQTLGILTTATASSEPNMSPKGHIKINIDDAEVYYNCNERSRTRNI